MPSMPHTFFSFFLIFSKAFFVLPFLLMGAFFIDRRLFLRAGVLVLFGIALNILLKSIFQVPLNPALKKDWWAFPSGHAQLAATLYGYLATKYRHRIFTLLAGILILGGAVALVHFGYHQWQDIFGAWIIAFVYVGLFIYVSESTFFSGRLALLSSLLLVFSGLIMEGAPKKVPQMMYALSIHALLTAGLWWQHLHKKGI